nr:ABC transporter B family member 1 [Ipomoea batatas]
MSVQAIAGIESPVIMQNFSPHASCMQQRDLYCQWRLITCPKLLFSRWLLLQLFCQKMFLQGSPEILQAAHTKGTQLLVEAVANVRTVCSNVIQKRKSLGLIQFPTSNSLRRCFVGRDRLLEVDMNAQFLALCFLCSGLWPDVPIFKDLNPSRPEPGKTLATCWPLVGCGRARVIALTERSTSHSSDAYGLNGKKNIRNQLKSLRRHIAVVHRALPVCLQPYMKNIAYGQNQQAKGGVQLSEDRSRGRIELPEPFLRKQSNAAGPKPQAPRRESLKGACKKQLASAALMLERRTIVLHTKPYPQSEMLSYSGSHTGKAVNMEQARHLDAPGKIKIEREEDI